MSTTFPVRADAISRLSLREHINSLVCLLGIIYIIGLKPVLALEKQFILLMIQRISVSSSTKFGHKFS